MATADCSAVDVMLYCADDMKDVAERMAIEGARAGTQIQVNTIDFSSFKDGWPNLFVEGAKRLRSHHTVFLASLRDPSDVFEQLAVIYALPRLICKSFKVLVPYFPTGTMERIERVGQIATAATLCRMLSATPPSATGPSQFIILDIHALQELFYFSDTVHIRLKSCVRLLRTRLRELPERDRVSIVFPDDGAYKRFHTKFHEFPHVVCVKRREGASRIVTIKEGDCAGRLCVMVDDLVQTGGTLIESAKALRAAGAADVWAYVTHAVFPESSWKRFTSCDPISKFFITDTIPQTAREIGDAPPFEVLSIASVLAAICHNPAMA